jgi:hypothetical protein
MPHNPPGSFEALGVFHFEFRISNFEFSEALLETTRVHRRCLASRHDVVLKPPAAAE